MQGIRWREHWDVIRQHWLFVVAVLILGPVLGYVVNDERGAMFGAAVAVVAVCWLWGAGRPRF